MKLYIMRHGEAATPVAGGEKALTLHGREQVARTTAIVQQQRPQLLIHSPKLRARQTAELIMQSGLAATALCDECLLPESSSGNVERVLSQRTEASIVLVSHLPLVARMVAWFTNGDERSYSLAGFPTAGLVAIDTDQFARGCGKLEFYAFAPDHEVIRL